MKDAFTKSSATVEGLEEILKSYEGTHRAIPLILPTHGGATRFELLGFTCRHWKHEGQSHFDVCLAPL